MSQKAYGVNELREMFLSFFESKGHLRLPSFSLIPQNDASLLLINSGMAPMKPYFKGEVEPPRRRVCTCQKCIRTGDIENIGKTARHGTYFEMLGNFSFGDYFKHEAIAWCWEFLTKVVGLDADRLYPSIYENDDEAFEIWNKEIGVPAEKIFRFGKEDNFWEHGSGPCGPCSEVYYDRGEKYGCGKPDCKVGCECDRFMEVWNNVFSQFDNDGNGNYTELVQKNIDTGMGLERLAVVCQDVNSLFDVDTVMNITNHVTRITGASYGQSVKTDVSLRVITDHIRASTFMIADGVRPTNEGRGYVLRRLLRRAARHGKLLGVNKPFLFEVVETVIQENEYHYGYLRERADYIVKTVLTEEENFARTIDIGMRIFSEKLAEHKAKGETVFSGADAFLLSDTYGFPIDLTSEMLEDENMTVDMDKYVTCREEQRIRAREDRKKMGDLGWAGIDLGLDSTPTTFIGYDEVNGEAKVLAVCVGEEVTGSITGGEKGIVVLDRTPFYAEMGGQVADHGVILVGDSRFEVTNVQKDKGGKYLHHGNMVRGTIKVDDIVCAAIDVERRKAIMRAHSATHLLQTALQSVLGDHVHQAGSFVEPDHLRFDFTHYSALTAEELAKVNAIVQAAVLEGYNIVTREMPIEEAKKLGAMALFSEKYGDTVRVVNMSGYSIELCGGTHLDNTAKVGSFEIDSEGSVASGVRRIEAVTGKECLKRMEKSQEMLFEAAAKLKSKPVDVVNRVQAQLDEIKELKRLIETFKAKETAGEIDRFLFAAHNVGGLKVITASIPNADANKLRQMGDQIRDKASDAVAVLSSVNDGKITFLAVCGKEAVAKGLKAGELVKMVCTVCGGSGGGKPDSAMGGGKDVLKVDDALAQVDDFVAGKLKKISGRRHMAAPFFERRDCYAETDVVFYWILWCLRDWRLFEYFLMADPSGSSDVFLAVLAACLSGWKRNFRVLIPTFLGIALGLGWFWVFEYFGLTPIRTLDNEVVQAEIEITDYSWETEYGSAADGELILGGKTYKTRVYVKNYEQLVPGDVLSGTFRIRATNGGQEADTFHSGEGIFLLAYQRAETEVKYSDYLKVKYFPAYLRLQIQSLINECFPEDTAAFARALLLGDDTDIDYSTDTALSISGIRHIVAVSGLHITILFSLVYNFMGRKRFLAALIGIPVLILFAAVVGFTPSVTRACIMQIMMILALLFNREYDPASALSAACLTMVVVNPLAITSVSLQLSAGCMIGIFYITPKIKAWLMDEKRLGKRKRKGIKRKLIGGFVSSVSTSLGATILTTPLSALYFGSVSTIGILSNLLTLWAVSLIFYGIIFACGLGFVWTGVGSMIAGAVSWLIRYVLLMAKCLSDFPLAAVYTVGDYTLVWLIICYLLMLGMFFIKKLRPLVAACLMIISLCVSLLFGWFVPRNECVLTVLDVGQGQCILFQSEGKTYLVDCGGSFEEDTADLAAETLLSQGIGVLDGVILTHYDNDHAGGTAMLLTRVSSDLLVAPEADEEDQDVLDQILEVHTGQLLQPVQDILIRYGNTSISVFAPETGEIDDQNGMCVLFQTENCDILITGDRNEAGERLLLQRRNLPELEVLIVGHHGSKYSTSQLLLDSTSPQTAIISVGADNSYGHPTDEVLQRLQAAGCEIYRTDIHGTVIYKG